MAKVSSCCGAHNRSAAGGSSYMDTGMCPDCKEHCDWVEEVIDWNRVPFPDDGSDDEYDRLKAEGELRNYYY